MGLFSEPSYQGFLDNFRRVKANGLVLEGPYARNYLGTERLRRFSIAHYILIGERTGCRPNPLFDPSHYRTQLSSEQSTNCGCLLLDYIDQSPDSSLAPSQEFNPPWYSWQNPDWRSSRHRSPFLHCIHTGLAEARDPAPGIDLQQLCSTKNLKGPYLIEYLFDELARRGQLSSAYAIYSTESLVLNQKRFREGITLTFHKTMSCAKNRWLVFVQAGKSFYKAYVNRPRNFDVMINYFEPPAGGLSDDFDTVIFQSGTKTTAIDAILKYRPELLFQYEAILLLDDDIEISARAIENLFQTMEQKNLALAQTSLSADSDCIWPVFKQPNVGEKVRLVNSVEIMMPALTRHALASAGWVFGASISGFGVDLLLGKACSDGFCGKAGIVGSSVAVHEKKIDDKGGAYYNYMRRQGINPKLELWNIIQKHSIIPDFYYLEDEGEHS